MRKYSRVLAVLIINLGLILLGPLSATAATSSASNSFSPATNGYRLSPVRTDLTISPGQSKTITVYIQNASSAVENLQVIINDFQAPNNETGYPALLLNGATAPQHSLKQFVTVPVPTFTLQPGQQEAVNVLIKIPAGTSSGGYYGAVRFGPVGVGGSKNVNLSASIASLVLITVPGNLNEQLTISKFGAVQGSGTEPHKFFFSNKNLQALVSFQNGGNVQVQPFGKILLKQGSKTLTSGAINNADVPGNVLPDSTRRFTVKLTHIGWVGKYQLSGNFGYGSKGQLLVANSTFYVIPLLLVIIVVIVLIIILLLIFGLPRLIKSYNRRVVARATNRQR